MTKPASVPSNKHLFAWLRVGVLCGMTLAYCANVAHAATLTVSANPISVTSGSPSTLTWSSSDATNCAASGAWSGIKAASGNQSVIAPNGLNTYALSCSGPSGSANNTVVIGAGTPAPALYTLNVTLSGSGTVTSNPSGIACGATCSASYPGGAAVTLSAAPAAGYIFSGWSGACSGTAACAVSMSAARSVTATFILASADLIFFDNFEYSVGRNDVNAVSLFQQMGGWEWGKMQQSSTGARGYLYTVTSIPGYTGTFPGGNSTRVLAMEALPASLNGQTDFFLQYGSPTGAIGQIPANHWFQFWVYSPATAAQRSVYTNGKFIYPNRADFYPATLSNGGYIYIASLAKSSSESLNLDCAPDQRSVPCDRAYYSTTWNDVAGLTNNRSIAVGGTHRFGQNLSTEASVVPGQWTLVKMHIDISGTDPRATPGHAVYEQWVRRLGSATWTKTTEWIGGVTQNLGSPIQFRPAFTDGFRMFRMPTTVGGTNSGTGDWYDYWLYIDDFAMARTEAALPQYP